MRKRGIWAAALSGLVAAAGLAPAMRTTATAAASSAPAQWISKTHTEAFGRLPTQAEWQADMDYFSAAGCNEQALAERGRMRYQSAEFMAAPYDASSRLLAAYRGLLNDEPDRGSFDARVARLVGGASWADVLDDVIADDRFGALVPAVCGENPNYYFGSSAPLRLPVQGTGFAGGTSIELQALLDATPPGGTVWLAPRALVTITKTLVVPADVTLATTGLPTPRSYAGMARLVRAIPAAAGGQPLIEVRAGGDLLSLWIDGQRGPYKNNSPTAQTVLVYGGAGSRIEHNVISNTAGPTALGTLGSLTCRDQIVRGNLITLYSTDHFDTAWSDGLTIGCEQSIVEDNEVVDATDVAIIVFTAAPAVQRSVVRNNRVLQAGNSAYGGLAVTEGNKTGTFFQPNPDFTGTRFEDNLIWTGPKAHFDFGLLAGIRAWYGEDTYQGRGAVFVRNTTGSQRIRANNGIVVSGEHDVVVMDNTIDTEVMQTTACPTAAVAASVSAGYASGQIQPYTDVAISGCLLAGMDPAHKDRHGTRDTTNAASYPRPDAAGFVGEELWHRPPASTEPVTTPPAPEPGATSAAGTIAVGNGATSVTMTDFQGQGCVAPTASQGLDAWIFDVRPGVSSLRMRLHGATGLEVGVVYYWAFDCRYLGVASQTGAAIDDTPPADAAWVAVHLASGAKANVALTWWAA